MQSASVSAAAPTMSLHDSFAQEGNFDRLFLLISTGRVCHLNWQIGQAAGEECCHLFELSYLYRILTSLYEHAEDARAVQIQWIAHLLDQWICRFKAIKAIGWLGFGGAVDGTSHLLLSLALKKDQGSFQ